MSFRKIKILLQRYSFQIVVSFSFFSGHFIFGSNNENKHEKLVAQTRKETKNVMVPGQTGGTVSWG